MKFVANTVFAGVLALVSVVAQPVVAMPDSRVPGNRTVEVLFSDTVDRAMLFIDGDYIAGPHHVTATAESVFVNGSLVAATEFSLPDSDDESGYRRRRSGSVDERRSLMHRSTRQNARHLSIRLQAGTVVLAFAEVPVIHLSAGDVEHMFYQALLQDVSTRLVPQEFLSQVSVAARPRMQEWLSKFEPSLSLRERIQAKIDYVDAVEAEGIRSGRALILKDALAYPLTLVAMMLGVVALGHLLKWTAQSIILNQGDTISAESVRGAEIALLLMAGMSVLDLIWTILAGQAGVMREVNPLAAGLINSPLALAVFKTSATSLGFALLYSLRTKRRGQEATWWMCLICVLVTFRWVMFDSMTA